MTKGTRPIETGPLTWLTPLYVGGSITDAIVKACHGSTPRDLGPYGWLSSLYVEPSRVAEPIVELSSLRDWVRRHIEPDDAHEQNSWMTTVLAQVPA